MGSRPRLLLVNSNEDALGVFREGLELRGLDTATAGDIAGALRLITDFAFDALLANLRTVRDEAILLTAMRRSQPWAMTLTLEGRMRGPSPEPLPDQVLVRPVGLSTVARLVQRKLLELRGTKERETVAAVLERELNRITQNWVEAVERDPDLGFIKMTFSERSEHLPMFFNNVLARLRLPRGMPLPVCLSAGAHGMQRRRRGYSPAMMVQEARLLQNTLLNTVQRNLHSLDCSQVLLDVIAIADELDLELKQAIRETNYTFVTPNMR